MAAEFIECELFIAGRDQGRLSLEGREYAGRPALDEVLERRLLELALEPVAYGSALFEAVFVGASGSMGDALARGYLDGLMLARQERLPLRLRVHVATTAPASLHALHWELLYDPDREVALARSQDTAFSRYLGVPFEPVTAVDGPVRLLAVSACPLNLADYGLPVLDWAEQHLALESALAPLKGRVTHELLEGPATVERIRDRLVEGAFHAVHVQAHGVLPKGADVARLVLEDDDHQAHFLNEQMFSELFEGRKELRLVTLVACHGGAPSRLEPFSGLAPTLIRVGVPSVVAMGRAVSVDGATRFTRHFYRNLMRQRHIDAAANEARRQMYLVEPESLEWSTPSLYMRSGEGALWSAGIETVNTADRRDTEDSVLALLKALLVCHWVGGTRLVEELGDRRAAYFFKRRDRVARDLLECYEGQEIDRGDGFLFLFDRPFDAVRYALDLQWELAELQKTAALDFDPELGCRIGIHLGEVMLRRTTKEDRARGAAPWVVEGLAKPTVIQLARVAAPGQILLSESAFDLARRGAVDGAKSLSWSTHGKYALQGLSAPLSVHEVRASDTPALPAPGDDTARRVAGDPIIAGWRPGPDVEIPGRPHWVLRKKLSKGGFGEVWSARHTKLGEERAFKFCFEAERLAALKREITLFRLLKEELGHRSDIARIVDWSFDQAPYFIESEIAAEGDWPTWAKDEGGLGQIPLEVRLELVAQVATALAAAHSVGVLHRDVKPANVLIREEPDGTPRAQLADFGIGSTEKHRLEAAGITVAGLTTEEGESPSASGTRLYMAPELLEGKRGTVQSDIYALGVMLYQAVVGDFTKALAPGWDRDVSDELLREDIRVAVDGSPERRLGNALRIAERLRSLDERRRDRAAREREQREAEEARKTLARVHRRRRLVAVVIAVLSIFGGSMAYLAYLLDAERKTAQRLQIVAEEKTALAEEKSALSERNEEIAKETLEFLLELLRSADPAKDHGRATTVQELLDKGTRIARSRVNMDPLVRARLLATLGEVHFRLENHQAARPLILEALAIRRRELGHNHPEVADSLHDLALLLRNLNELETVESHYLDAIDVLESYYEPGHPSLVKPLRGLGVFYASQGDLEAAETKLVRAWSIVEAHHPEDLEAAITLGALAYLRNGQNKLEEAVLLNRKALAILRGVEDQKIRLSMTLDNICRLLQYRELYGEAITYCEEALSIRQEIFEPGHSHIAKSLTSLGAVLQARGQYEEAARYYSQALEIEKKVYGASHRSVGVTLRNLASLSALQGKDREAEDFYRQAIQVFKEILPPGHELLRDAEAELAELYRRRAEGTDSP